MLIAVLREQNVVPAERCAGLEEQVASESLAAVGGDAYAGAAAG